MEYCPGCHFVNRNHRHDCPTRRPSVAPGEQECKHKFDNNGHCEVCLAYSAQHDNYGVAVAPGEAQREPTPLQSSGGTKCEDCGHDEAVHEDSDGYGCTVSWRETSPAGFKKNYQCPCEKFVPAVPSEVAPSREQKEECVQTVTGNLALDELVKLRDENQILKAMLEKAGEAMSSSYDVDTFPDGSLGTVRNEIKVLLETAGLKSCEIATSKERFVAAYAPPVSLDAPSREQRLEDALREARIFVDRHSEEWYTTGQELLKKIDAALEAK